MSYFLLINVLSILYAFSYRRRKIIELQIPAQNLNRLNQEIDEILDRLDPEEAAKSAKLHASRDEAKRKVDAIYRCIENFWFFAISMVCTFNIPFAPVVLFLCYLYTRWSPLYVLWKGAYYTTYGYFSAIDFVTGGQFNPTPVAFPIMYECRHPGLGSANSPHPPQTSEEAAAATEVAPPAPVLVATTSQVKRDKGKERIDDDAHESKLVKHVPLVSSPKLSSAHEAKKGKTKNRIYVPLHKYGSSRKQFAMYLPDEEEVTTFAERERDMTPEERYVNEQMSLKYDLDDDLFGEDDGTVHQSWGDIVNEHQNRAAVLAQDFHDRLRYGRASRNLVETDARIRQYVPYKVHTSADTLVGQVKKITDRLRHFGLDDLATTYLNAYDEARASYKPEYDDFEEISFADKWDPEPEEHEALDTGAVVFDKPVAPAIKRDDNAVFMLQSQIALLTKQMEQVMIFMQGSVKHESLHPDVPLYPVIETAGCLKSDTVIATAMPCCNGMVVNAHTYAEGFTGFDIHGQHYYPSSQVVPVPIGEDLMYLNYRPAGLKGFPPAKLREPIEGEKIGVYDAVNKTIVVGVVGVSSGGYQKYNISSQQGTCGSPVVTTDGHVVGWHSGDQYFTPVTPDVKQFFLGGATAVARVGGPRATTSTSNRAPNKRLPSPPSHPRAVVSFKPTAATSGAAPAAVAQN